MSKRGFETNGNGFGDLEGFFDEIPRSLRPVTRAATVAAFLGAVACSGSNRSPTSTASDEQLPACGYCMYPPMYIPGRPGCPVGCRGSDGGILLFEHNAHSTLDAAPLVDAVAAEPPDPVDPINAALERLASDAAVEPRPQPGADPCLECCMREPLCTCVCPDHKGSPWRPRGRVRR
jgi:hypothetical protein